MSLLKCAKGKHCFLAGPNPVCLYCGVPEKPIIVKTQEQTITEAAFDALAAKMRLTIAAKIEKRDRDLWDAFIVTLCCASYREGKR